MDLDQLIKHSRQNHSSLWVIPSQQFLECVFHWRLGQQVQIGLTSSEGIDEPRVEGVKINISIDDIIIDLPRESLRFIGHAFLPSSIRAYGKYEIHWNISRSSGTINLNPFL